MLVRGSLVIGLWAACNCAFGLELKRAQEPSLSPDGSKIAFGWQGDVWTVSNHGGVAQRLTVHPSNDQTPIWTPDGKAIVFTSSRSGVTDLYQVAPDGTQLKRLTFEGASVYPYSFSPDGKKLYGWTTKWGSSGLFRVDASGGDLIQLTYHPMEGEAQPSVSPDGKRLAYIRGSAGGWRNPWANGSSAGDIWVAEVGVPLKNHRNLTPSPAVEISPVWLPNGRMLFLSNRSGWPNLWVMEGNGSNPRQLTRHSVGIPRRPQASTDGTKVVYEYDSEIWLLDVASGANHRVAIQVQDDARNVQQVQTTLTDGVTSYAVAPGGKRIAASIRGDLWLMASGGGLAQRLTTNPGFDGHPVFVGPKKMVYVAMDAGRRRLMSLELGKQPEVFLDTPEDLSAAVLSPDGKSLAFCRGGKQIQVVPVGGGVPKTVVEGPFYGMVRGDTDFSWSPDSKWIVFENRNTRSSTIEMVQVEESRKVVLAKLARGAYSTPAFTPDGKSVYFVAPEYDEPNLFAVDLVPPARTFPEDALDKIDDPKPKDAKVEVKVHEPGIDARLRRLTTVAVSSPIALPEGRGYWVQAEGKLSFLPASGGRPTPLAGATSSVRDLKIFENRTYGLVSGKVAAMGSDGASAPVSFTAPLALDRKAEEMALFEEVGWAIDRFYYREDIKGRDWKAIRKRFADLVPHAQDRADFYNLMNEMMNEIGSSHLGAGAPGDTPPPTGGESSAWLGVFFDPAVLESKGVHKVSKVFQNSPADHPDAGLQAGDVVLAVDGLKPGKEQTLSSLLFGKSGRKVSLSIDRNGKPMDIVVKPESAAGVRSAGYEDWLRYQEAETSRLSNGQLAYFHIQGMNDASYREFLRAIRTRTVDKKGMILDVRFNGGGSTSHLILSVLIKTPWLRRTSRGFDGYDVSENIYRGDALELPTGLLINQSSFSNAEIFAEGFRKLKLGPIVGVQTAGGVIGTGTYGLWDGGSIRMPGSGAYAIDGEDLEGNGRKPDFPVPYDPDLWVQGRDAQLERLVKEMLRKLD